jgi:hypothetical protein
MLETEIAPIQVLRIGVAATATTAGGLTVPIDVALDEQSKSRPSLSRRVGRSDRT